MEKTNYNETVQSRFDDIKRDGPNIYTGLLENTDNSIDWGGATKIEIIHNRESITIKDNGPNGFGSLEALKRFFTIGKTNEGNITDVTIGKYGKGGYKATISMGNRVEVTTYFDGNKYTYGTNFIEMEERDSMEPTMKLTCSKNETDEIGTEIKIYLRHEIGLAYNSVEAKRHFIRAYHDYGKDIDFSLKSGKDNLTFNPSDFCPYEKFQKEKAYYVYYQNEGDHFVYKETYDDNCVIEIKTYVLQDLIKRNPLLSDRKPGIDFYRCGRMCNTRYPIFNIGDVGVNITQGQMRGMRCHITCKFNDTKITDIMSMDDYIGVTTVKDIYEDDRMNKSIIKILNEISKDTSQMYENLIAEQKDSFNTFINEIHETVSCMLSMDEDILLENKYPLTETLANLKNYVLYQMYYFDMEKLEFRFCTSKNEVKEYNTNKQGTKCTKSNSIYKQIRDSIVPDIEKLLVKKSIVEEKEVEIQKVMKEQKLPREEAKTKYKEIMKQKTAEAAEAKRKQNLEGMLTNANANYKSKNYNEAVKLYNDYIETKDGDCNEISDIILKIREEQIDELKKNIDEEIERNNFDKAYELTDDIISITDDCTEEMEAKKEEINQHQISYYHSEAMALEDEEKYNSAIKKYETILADFTMIGKAKEEIILNIDRLKKKEVEQCKEKIEKLIEGNSFKEAKKYCNHMKRINKEESEKTHTEIEAFETKYEERIQTITVRDVNNIFENIMKDCNTGEKIQKFFKVLEYFHNNP